MSWKHYVCPITLLLDTITHLFKCKCITQLLFYSMTHLFRCKCIPPTNISYKTFYTIQGVPKKIGFRKVAQFSPRGVWAVKIWIFWGAEHKYAITRGLPHIPNTMCSHLCDPPFYPLHIWIAIWSKVCYFPKAIFF